MTDAPDLTPRIPASIFYGRPDQREETPDAEDIRAANVVRFAPPPPSPQAAYRRSRARLIASIVDLLISAPIKHRWRLLREQIAKIERALASDPRNTREFVAVEKFEILKRCSRRFTNGSA